MEVPVHRQAHRAASDRQNYHNCPRTSPALRCSPRPALTSPLIEIRNAVAHRHLPALDPLVIPLAQAGLLKTEAVLVDVFGTEYALGDRLSVPLQLSGFRDPDVLTSRKRLQASLPLDVQAILSSVYDAPADLLVDPTYMMRVAFVPMVPGSGRSPDVVAYFVRPGAVTSELEETLDRYIVLPKPMKRPNFNATQVIDEVQRRTGCKLNTIQHAQVSRALGVRPGRGEPDATLSIKYAEYITSFKRYLYSQAWIDLLVEKLSIPERFADVTGVAPVAIDPP